MQKKVQRELGVMKGRLKILRLDIRSYYLANVMFIVNTCVILHDLVFRIKQNRDFEDEADGDYLITQLLE